VTKDECYIYNFDDAKYSYSLNEWCYESDDKNTITESKFSELISEDEERRVALDYEREEHHKNSLYKSIEIY